MNLYEIYFSPTGGTKKVADILARGMEEKATVIDLIKESGKLEQIKFTEKDLCLIAVPSYGGRVPSVVVDVLKQIKGNGAKAVLVAVYGNRAIDDTLTELKDVLEASGFACLAGMEALAEHSLMHQFAAGRPDKEDEKVLLGFAKQIKDKFLENGDKSASEAADSQCSSSLTLPGSHTYRKYNGVPMKPSANRKCISCGLCAKECPAGAIPKENPKATDKEKCISCMHCVYVCPKNARHYSKLLSFVASQKMKKNCSDRKENKLYL